VIRRRSQGLLEIGAPFCFWMKRQESTSRQQQPILPLITPTAPDALSGTCAPRDVIHMRRDLPIATKITLAIKTHIRAESR
jgi:hypothetical protein